MPSPKLFNDTMAAYKRALDFRSQRHSIISTNLSNAETPGFQAKDVEFEGMLKEALSSEKGLSLAKTHAKHFGGGGDIEILSSQPEIVPVDSPANSFDGNTVSVDKEMGKLNENSLLFQTETEILARLFSGLKTAINGGAR
jgi:flagellar basal-body rod protein FlgB